MKKIIFAAFCLLNFDMLGKPTHESSATFNGVANLENQNFKKLTVHGAANFEKVKASDLHVHGALNAKSCEFENAFISGGVNLEMCVVTAKIFINGGFHAKGSQFYDLSVVGGCSTQNCKISGKLVVAGGAMLTGCKINEFVANGNEHEFKNSDVAGSLKIEKPNGGWFWWFFGKKTQEIRLIDTIVHGDIVFEQEGGIVKLSGNSKIFGTIKNGKIA